MLAFYLALCDTPEQEDIFIAIYNENRKTMLMKAEGILHNNGWSEDAVHDAFLRIASNIHTFIPLSCNERRYLCVTIVRNVALNLLRDSHQDLMESLDDTDLPSADIDLSDDMIAVERIAELVQYIEELPQALGDVVHFRLVLGLSSAETAKLLKITEEAERVRLHRGRKLLIAMLAKGGITHG